jgi:hypothetical protein
MAISTEKQPSEVRPDIWPALVSIALVGVVAMVLGQNLGLVPLFFSAGLLVVLLSLVGVLFVEARRARRRVPLMRMLGQTAAAIASLELAVAVVSVAVQLREPDFTAGELLRYAASLWIMNILIFAVWYWEMDTGGPHARHAMACYTSQDFVFPQRQIREHDDWQPGFIVYLFLAFTTSTAFSPTDTLVLSDRARLLMMAQSAISLITLALLAARAVSLFDAETKSAPSAPQESSLSPGAHLSRAAAWLRASA